MASRRRLRLSRAGDGAALVRAHVRACHRREQGRRRRHHWRRGGGARPRRWLHPAAGQCGNPCHCAEHAQQALLRAAERFCRDHALRHQPVRAGGASGFSGEHDAGAAGADQVAAGQVHLLVGRTGQHLADRHGDVQGPRRVEHPARSFSGAGAGDHVLAWRPDRFADAARWQCRDATQSRQAQGFCRLNPWAFFRYAGCHHAEGGGV